MVSSGGRPQLGPVFASTVDQEAFRGRVRDFLADHAPLRPPPDHPEQGTGFDRGSWRRLTGELGLLDAVLSDTRGALREQSDSRDQGDSAGPGGAAGPGCGGRLGGGPVELAILAEEAGAALYPGPLLSASALAGPALACSGSQAGERLLRDVCSGRTVVAFAASRYDPVLRGSRAAALRAAAGSLDPGRTGAGHTGPGRIFPGRVEVTRSDSGDCLLSGTQLLAVDGTSADIFLIAASGHGPPARGRASGMQLFAASRDAPGVHVTPMAALDLDRGIAAVTLNAAPGQLIAAAPAAATALATASRHAALFLAAEQLGVARHCLDASVGYAKTRAQSGRAIGSFQAVGHMLADMLAGVEQARSAVYYAAWQAARNPAPEPDPERDFAIAAAAAFCAEVAATVTAGTIQVLGGIGCTREHAAHRYFRRAHADALLSGGPVARRRAAAAALDQMTAALPAAPMPPVVGGGQADELIAVARRTGGWADPVLRDQITALAIAERVLQMTNLRAHVAGRGGRPGAEGSITRLAASELAQRISEAAVAIEPYSSLAWPAGEALPPSVDALLGSRAATIAGGTSQIQRTIIADHLLGQRG